jgi:hypothetical protein
MTHNPTPAENLYLSRRANALSLPNTEDREHTELGASIAKLLRIITEYPNQDLRSVLDTTLELVPIADSKRIISELHEAHNRAADRFGIIQAEYIRRVRYAKETTND